MIVPDRAAATVGQLVIFVLPDDERHVWSALRALGLLELSSSAAKLWR